MKVDCVCGDGSGALVQSGRLSRCHEFPACRSGSTVASSDSFDQHHTLRSTVYRGHDVMTVVPRYSSYPEVHDTGCIVPLKGRMQTETSDGVKPIITHSRLYVLRRDGVDRVFVNHPCYTQENADMQDDGASSGSAIYPYHPTVVRQKSHS